MKWLLILTVYAAPADAVDWDGPWTYGMSVLHDDVFESETACRNEAIGMIGQIHQGMLAPIRYRCISVENSLPEGAPR